MELPSAKQITLKLVDVTPKVQNINADKMNSNFQNQIDKTPERHQIDLKLQQKNIQKPSDLNNQQKSDDLKHVDSSTDKVMKRQNSNFQASSIQNSFKLTITLTGCKYEIFKRLCLQDLSYRVIIQKDQQNDYDLQVITFNKQTNQSVAIPYNQFQPKELQWEIWWQDFGIQPDFLTQMQSFQRVNHFLGMYHIARKNHLGIQLRKFRKEFEDEYNFFPQTWLYPQDFHEIQEYNQRKYKKRNEEIASGMITQEASNADPPIMFIIKPEAGCQGKGIFIARKLEELQQRVDGFFKKQQTAYDLYLKAEESYDTVKRYGNQNMAQTGYNYNQEEVQPPEIVYKDHSYVVQKYIKQPALWKDHKFDFRIYVLITTVIEPMTIFLYNDGLVRLASEKYQTKNINDVFVHLTNYSLNKKNNNFDNNAHKLKVSECLTGTLTQPPYKKGKPAASRSAESIWDEIESIVVKTVLTVQPQLQHIYRSCQQKEPDCCFELLGFDIMLDAKLKPWMIEVNHTPSFNSDTSVDEKIKADLLKDTFDIIQLSVEQRKAKEWDIRQEKKQLEVQGLYKRVSAKEHCERVRFDPKLVAQKFPNSGYRLIYPKDAPGEDPDLYVRIQKKSSEMWKLATGTVPQKREQVFSDEKKKAKKKKKKQKKKRASSTALNLPDRNEDEGSSQEENESNWQGGAQAEEIAVKKHLQEAGQAEESVVKSHIFEFNRGPEDQKPNVNQTPFMQKRTSALAQVPAKSTPDVVNVQLKHNPSNMSNIPKQEAQTCLQCCGKQSLLRQQSTTSYGQQANVQGDLLCGLCGKAKQVSSNAGSSSIQQRPTVSSHAKKVPVKRETLKLATVGAIGAEQPSHVSISHHPEVTLQNHYLTFGNHQFVIPAGLTEAEIIAQIIKFTSGMKLDLNFTHSSRPHPHQQIIDLFKNQQSVPQPKSLSKPPQQLKDSKTKFLNQVNNYSRAQVLSQKIMMQQNEPTYFNAKNLMPPDINRVIIPSQQSKLETANGWFIQRLQTILDTQINPKSCAGNHSIEQPKSKPHGLISSSQALSNKKVIQNQYGITNEQLFRQLLPELIEEDSSFKKTKMATHQLRIAQTQLLRQQHQESMLNKNASPGVLNYSDLDSIGTYIHDMSMGVNKVINQTQGQYLNQQMNSFDQSIRIQNFNSVSNSNQIQKSRGSSLLFTHRQNLQNVAYKINQQYQSSLPNETIKAESSINTFSRLPPQKEDELSGAKMVRNSVQTLSVNATKNKKNQSITVNDFNKHVSINVGNSLTNKNLSK